MFGSEKSYLLFKNKLRNKAEKMLEQKKNL